MSRLSNERCVLCTRRSTLSGEHVWPQWLLDEFPESHGPYTTYRRDIPITKQDGQPRTFNAFPRVKVPMCEPPNGHLNTRFEQPVKAVIRALLAAEGQVCSARPRHVPSGCGSSRRGLC